MAGDGELLDGVEDEGAAAGLEVAGGEEEIEVVDEFFGGGGEGDFAGDVEGELIGLPLREAFINEMPEVVGEGDGGEAVSDLEDGTGELVLGEEAGGAVVGAVEVEDAGRTGGFLA